MEERSRLRRRRRPSDEGGPEDRPPELVVGRLIDQDMILTWKEPGQRAGRELVATFAEQVGGGATHDEVDLDLGMTMDVRSSVAGRVSNRPPIQTGPYLEFLDHRKKR